MAIAACGFKPHENLEPRYLPGFVAGSQNIFRPARVAVAPAGGGFSAGSVEVGHIYAADGNVQSTLAVSDPRRIVTQATIAALGDSGLVPVALDAVPRADSPVQTEDYVLVTELKQFKVEKHFGAEKTVHGQYFTMNASVRIAFELRSREGKVLFAGELDGIEVEPPATVGHEVFLPLETSPAEALSVAMSRAVGTLMLQPGFRGALPMRPVAPTPAASATPVPIPGVVTPSHH